MKFKKIFILLLNFIIFVSFFKSENKCCALLTNEEYYSCFEKQDLSGIIVTRTNDEDKKILRDMINREDDFSKFLGYGCDKISADEYLESLEQDNELILTVKNIDNKIVGLVFAGKGSNENRLNIGYWVGKDFRGNGYAHLAVSKIM